LRTSQRTIGAACALVFLWSLAAIALDPLRPQPLLQPERLLSSGDAGGRALPPSPQSNELLIDWQKNLDAPIRGVPILLKNGMIAVMTNRGEIRVLSERGTELASPSFSLPLMGSAPSELASHDLVIAGLNGLQGLSLGPPSKLTFSITGSFLGLSPLSLGVFGFAVAKPKELAFYERNGDLFRSVELQGTPIVAPWLSESGKLHVVTKDGSQTSLYRIDESPVLVASFRKGALQASTSANMLVLTYENAAVLHNLVTHETRELSASEPCASASPKGASVLGIKQGKVSLQVVIDGDVRAFDLGAAQPTDAGVGAGVQSACVTHAAANGAALFGLPNGRVGLASARGLALPLELPCGADAFPTAVIPWGQSAIAVACSQGTLVRLSVK
jgi:hypothetical protein